MTAPSSTHGFDRARGRGYRPAQVDRQVSLLSDERDHTWERLARLTVLAKEMGQDAERLAGVVAALPPQTFEALGNRAMLLLSEAEAQAVQLRRSAEAQAERLEEAAEAAARERREAAWQAAQDRRTEADAAADSVLGATRNQAEELLAEARERARTLRDEAQAALAEVARRCESLLAGQRDEQAATVKALEEELAGEAAAAQERIDKLTEHGESLMAEAERQLADARETARQLAENARVRHDELLNQARLHEQRTAHETERMVREHTERAEEMRSHMTHVRSSLSTLTSRVATGGTVPGQASGPESESD